MFLEILGLLPDEIELTKESIVDFEENQQKIINKLIALRKYQVYIRHFAYVKISKLHPDSYNVRIEDVSIKRDEIEYGFTHDNDTYKCGNVYETITLTWEEIIF